MIKILKNSKTENYKKLKEHILSPYFPWLYTGTTVENAIETAGFRDMPQYGHVFISRPEQSGWSQPVSELHQSAAEVVREILEENGLHREDYIFIRMSANTTSPNEGVQFSLPHEDHKFPHFNFLTYLTNSGGSTFVMGEENKPEEDQSIIFTGSHYMQLPKRDRRVVLVATLMSAVGS